MVLERLFSVKELLDSPLLLSIYTMIIVVIASLTAYLFFEKNASILTIAFISIAFTYFMYATYRMTEQEVSEDKIGFFSRYGMVIFSYLKIFLAITLVFAILYVALPQQYKLVLFSEQIETLQGVSGLRANIISSIGHFFLSVPDSSANLGLYIFLNNIEVMFAVILLSFIYGAGAVFLIAYQASLMGTIIGQNILSLFGQYNNLGMYGQIVAVLHGSFQSLGLLPHGVFEILAYFIGAIIGGIISAALIGHYANSKETFLRTLRDTFILLVVAVACLALGAIIETFIILR